MPDKQIIDTVTQTQGKRMRVHKEGGTTYIPYSNGVELTVEKTDVGDGQRLKEVRTVTKVKTPRTYYVGGFGPGRWAEIRAEREARRAGSEVRVDQAPEGV